MLLPALNLKAQNMEVVITGIRSPEGQMAIGIFTDNESFQQEKAFLEKKFEKADITDGEMRVRFSLVPGTYGFALLDDENSNGKMEYNFLGMPKEGFGFSDYYHTGLLKPKFDSFSFTLIDGQTKLVAIRIKYIL
ncbi:MAG: DUF2141 domain-containing protein [Bacteroidales bacterium]|nr:DUF2141 domain-containing protein [Bacteroidales bacterium]